LLYGGAGRGSVEAYDSTAMPGMGIDPFFEGNRQLQTNLLDLVCALEES
jgi:hypothetical protein